MSWTLERQKPRGRDEPLDLRLRHGLRFVHLGGARLELKGQGFPHGVFWQKKGDFVLPDQSRADDGVFWRPKLNYTVIKRFSTHHHLPSRQPLVAGNGVRLVHPGEYLVRIVDAQGHGSLWWR